jgi:hypothetical protein
MTTRPSTDAARTDASIEVVTRRRTIRLNEARMRRNQTNLTDINHPLPPSLNENATSGRSDRLLQAIATSFLE